MRTDRLIKRPAMTIEPGVKPTEPRVIFGYLDGSFFSRRFKDWEAMSRWIGQRSGRKFEFVRIVSLETWSA